jgi:hypothetical protein
LKLEQDESANLRVRVREHVCVWEHACMHACVQVAWGCVEPGGRGIFTMPSKRNVAGETEHA